MELLNENESRAFSSFLDSFTTTSASPPPHLPLSPAPFATQQYYPSTAQSYGQQDPYLMGGSGLAFRPSQQGRSSVGGAENHHLSRGGESSEWNMSGTVGAYQPHLQYLPSFPQQSTSSPFTNSQFAPPPSQQRSTNPYQRSLESEAEAAKQRKMQHAEELQKWMSQSQSQQPPARPTSLDSPSPPKRTRSSEDTVRADGGGEQDAITAMLEAERKAGYAYGRSMNAAITRETSESRERARKVSPPQPQPIEALQPEEKPAEQETFAPPPPPTSIRSTRRRPSTNTQQTSSFPTDDDDDDAYIETPKPKTKRKAPPSTAPSRSNSISSKQRILPSAATTSRDSASVDPESADSSLLSISPTPFKTPRNIPPPVSNAARPPCRRKIRSTSSSSASQPPPPTKSGSRSSASNVLLTNEQKKANHIASEQKRRAAIRQAYDGLCSVVPVLREAVQEFEERVRKLEREAGGSSGNGRGKKRKGGKGSDGKTGALMGGINVGGEKIDGRAGPKSEAVVLSKTVDHVRQLLSNRATLLERLSKAHEEAQEKGIEVPPASAHEWDEAWDGDSADEEEVGGGVKDEEDEEMWEDE